MVFCFLTVLFCHSALASEQPYEHDPRFSASTMKDVKYDPAAVYGFSPREDSVRLGSYAAFDWSDPGIVEQGRNERIAYFESIKGLSTQMEQMFSEGRSMEEVARAISGERNRIRLEAYKDNPDGLKAAKESNLLKYGNEEGPTADSLFEKYGSWETVLNKAFSPNSGMDACLGLYDEQYAYNVLLGEVTPDDSVLYTIVKNDNLRKIAVTYFADENKWKGIFSANRDRISDANLIYEGETILIPVN